MATLLEKFDSIISTLLSEERIVQSGNDCWTIGENPKHLLSCMIHGNEILGLHLIIDLLSNLKENSSFGLILGNRKATQLNKRFVERDLNRAFLNESIKNLEEVRAKEIEEFAKKFKFILDIHQTSHIAENEFFLCRNHQESLEMAELFPNSPLVFLKDSKMSSEGEGFGSFCLKESIPFLTVELGKMGMNEKFFKLGQDFIQRFLKFSGEKMALDLQKEAYAFSHTLHKNDKNDNLVEGITNFQFIPKGKRLLQNREENSPIDGYALFPKYGDYQKFSKDLCQILEKKKLGDMV